ncbi:hypothetical protein ACN4EK_27795 [Pantanalinema rosaneae CENA516]|uniref:hypothetical protein n=1 Tax=Pantanalinema rosaneae TaxID=1620701 RepID=UPI003D6F78B1
MAAHQAPIAYLTADQPGQAPTATITVGHAALTRSEAESLGSIPTGLLLHDFKHYLNLAIPYFSPSTQTWEPVIQWSNDWAITLGWFQQALIRLLAPLNPGTAPELPCLVEGLSSEQAQAALQQLAGVVVSQPTGWSEAYRFNVREAILTTGLVERPEQVVFLEDPIAALLTQLAATPVSTTLPLMAGMTVVISAGATTTQLLLTTLPSTVDPPSRGDCHLRSLAYAGQAIDQDIICQLLYSTTRGWEKLGLDHLDLPLPGEPDLPTRYRLQQQLESTWLGRELVNAVRTAKPHLSQQHQVNFTLERQQWSLSQRDWHHRVVLPYLQQLNRELNLLLHQAGATTETIQQVICWGGTTQMTSIALWLQQKLPHATIIPFHRDRSLSLGLARLPIYPKVFDTQQHQPNEYFLLDQIVHHLPDQPLPVGQIFQVLEQQGVDLSLYQAAILSRLEGQLPEGLVTTAPEIDWLTPLSQQHPDIQALSSGQLFSRHGSQIYHLNPQIRSTLRLYLAALLTNTHQTMQDDLTVNLEDVLKVSKRLH